MTRPRGSKAERVAVVGGGVMGLASASALARRGYRATLFERGAIGHDRGSSWGPVRIFRLAYEQPEYVRAGLRARELWRELERRSATAILSQTGGIDLGDPIGVAAVRAAYESAGAEHRTLSRAEAAGRWPDVKLSGEVLFQPDAGVIRAEVAVRALLAEAVEAGAEIRERAAVTVESTSEAVLVRTDAGRDEFDAAVLAVGAWTEGVASPMIAVPPLRVSEEFPLEFHVPGASALPVGIEHRGAGQPLGYWLPVGGDLVKGGLHASGRRLADPDDRGGECPPSLAEQVSAYVAGRLRDVDGAPRSLRTGCLYDRTVDDHFIIERAGDVVVLGGFSGHGFKFAPLIGELAADLVTGEPGPLDVLPRSAHLERGMGP